MLGRGWTAYRALPVALQVPLAVIAGVVALGIGTALGAVVAPAEDREQPFPVLPTAPTVTTTSTTSTTSTTLPPTTTSAAPTTAAARAVTTTVAPATTRATAPATTTTARATICSPSYPTVCIPPPPPDLDCGDIPHRRFTVLPPDPHRFDGNDDDGLGCESG